MGIAVARELELPKWQLWLLETIKEIKRRKRWKIPTV